MKQQLDNLNRQAMSLITDYAGKNDPATIACIASTANRIRQLKDKLDEIEHEIPRLKDILLQYSRQLDAPQMPRPAQIPSVQTQTNGQHKSARKKIRIEVDWSRLEKTKVKGKEIICEHMASNSMTKWVIRLFQELGEQILPKLHGVRINRGPFVSREPQKDFQNNSDGTLYQYQPILNTGYYVLTHSNTSQKIGDIQKACQALGLPIGMVIVEEVEKNDWLFKDFTV
jgi:hypothetical protein